MGDFTNRYSALYDKIGEPVLVKQKRESVSALFIVLFLIGIVLLAYPYLGNAWNEMTNTTAVTNYKYAISKYSAEEKQKVLSDAQSYNNHLTTLTNQFDGFGDLEDYNSVLNVDGHGMMGFVRIPILNIRLAIYHGFDDAILDQACGHLEGTSFPVGGKSTHAVISAHRGLPSAKLFSDLNKLEIGQTFSIEVLDQILYYTVDKITICDPDDTKELRIIPDEDHVTLLTCTPYGINTHRLLVRGVRCDNPYGFFSSFHDETFRLDPRIICLILALMLLVMFLAWFLLKQRPKRPLRNVDLDELERQYIIYQIGEYDCNIPKNMDIEDIDE